MSFPDPCQQRSNGMQSIPRELLSISWPIWSSPIFFQISRALSFLIIYRKPFIINYVIWEVNRLFFDNGHFESKKIKTHKSNVFHWNEISSNSPFTFLSKHSEFQFRRYCRSGKYIELDTMSQIGDRKALALRCRVLHVLVLRCWTSSRHT